MNPTRIESQRDSVPQPKVAESARLPWVTHRNNSQPQRGCVGRRVEICHNPGGVDAGSDSFSQGIAALNPGLIAIAPLGQIGSPSNTGSWPNWTRCKRRSESQHARLTVVAANDSVTSPYATDGTDV